MTRNCGGRAALKKIGGLLNTSMLELEITYFRNI